MRIIHPLQLVWACCSFCTCCCWWPCLVTYDWLKDKYRDRRQRHRRRPRLIPEVNYEGCNFATDAPRFRRPITPPLHDQPRSDDQECIEQRSWFFTDIPFEVRRRIYDFALGEQFALVVSPNLLTMRLQKCLEPERSMCLKEMGQQTSRSDGQVSDTRMEIATALLRTCRQV